MDDGGDDDLEMRREPAVETGRALARRAASGVKWGFIGTASQQIVRLLFTLVLVRIIGPESFGITSQATIYITFTGLLLDSGFGAALIQRRRITEEDIGSVFWLNVLAGLIVAAITLAVAPLVADFFHTPELSAVLRVLSILVLLNALLVVPLSLVQRRLEFRTLAISQSVSVVVGGIAGVAAAAAGADYWAIVVQSLTTSTINLAALLAVAGRPHLKFSFQRLREMFAFTWGIMGSRLALFAGQNVDNILIGRYLGARQLAFYALSYRLLKLPIGLIGQIVNQVSLSTFSRLQHQPDRMRRWFLTSTTAMATGTYGFLTVAILGAPDGVPLLFGRKWEPAVRAMQILILVSYRSLVVMLVGPVFTALGRTRRLLAWTVGPVAVTIIGAAIGLQWGIVGVASGVAIGMYLLAPFSIAAAGRLISLRAGEYTRAILPAWVASACVVLAWFPVHSAFTSLGSGPTLRLALSSLIGLGVYAAVIRIFFNSTFVAMREVAAMVFGRTRQPAATGSAA